MRLTTTPSPASPDDAAVFDWNLLQLPARHPSNSPEPRAACSPGLGIPHITASRKSIPCRYRITRFTPISLPSVGLGNCCMKTLGDWSKYGATSLHALLCLQAPALPTQPVFRPDVHPKPPNHIFRKSSGRSNPYRPWVVRVPCTDSVLVSQNQGNDPTLSAHRVDRRCTCDCRPAKFAPRPNWMAILGLELQPNLTH